jgi:hypothetical protein
VLIACSSGNPDSIKLPKYSQRDARVLIVRDPAGPDTRANVGRCWPDAKPGDVCAEGQCSCGRESRAPIWVCDTERQCSFLRYERCPANSC